MSNARKLFRVLKSLIEYKKIMELLGKQTSMVMYKFILKLIPRVAFFIYWIFDTLVVLRKINVLPSIDLAWVSYRWAFFWTIANLTSALGALVELVDLAKEEAKLIAKKKLGSTETSEK